MLESEVVVLSVESVVGTVNCSALLDVFKMGEFIGLFKLLALFVVEE